MTLLFCALTAFVELPTQMNGRPILYKQQSWALYRPAAMPCAQLFAEVPVTLFRTLIFTAIIWLLCFYHGHNVTGMSSTDMAANYFWFFIVTWINVSCGVRSAVNDGTSAILAHTRAFPSRCSTSPWQHCSASLAQCAETST